MIYTTTVSLEGELKLLFLASEYKLVIELVKAQALENVGRKNARVVSIRMLINKSVQKRTLTSSASPTTWDTYFTFNFPEKALPAVEGFLVRVSVPSKGRKRKRKRKFTRVEAKKFAKRSLAAKKGWKTRKRKLSRKLGKAKKKKKQKRSR